MPPVSIKPLAFSWIPGHDERVKQPLRWIGATVVALAAGLVTTLALAWLGAWWFDHTPPGAIVPKGGKSHTILLDRAHWFVSTLERPLVSSLRSAGTMSYGNDSTVEFDDSEPGYRTIHIRADGNIIMSATISLTNAMTAEAWTSRAPWWSRFREREWRLDESAFLEKAYGWPCRALGLVWKGPARQWGTNILTGAWPPGGMPGGPAAGPVLAFPLTPLWRGLIADVVVWAGVWVLLVAGSRALVRARRRRRGACEQCGYSLQSLESERCPECGRTR